MADDVTQFMQIFGGRTDCYGAWDGGCIKEPLTTNRYVDHLTFGPHIGVYPNLGDHVTWGCIDIDFDDLTLARRLQAALGYKQVQAWIERTRKGWHVWVFPEKPVSAATMRRALMAACKAIGYDPREVNPKQEQLEPGKVGNYVRLPYYGALVNDGQPDRYFLNLHTGEPLNLVQFLTSVRNVGFTEVANLESIASLWSPPVTAVSNLDTAGADVEHILTVLSGKAYVIWRDGPLPGCDRSTTLAKLAYLLAEEGLTATAAFSVLASADARWGKFADRPDRDHQLTRFIERAYS